MSEQDTTLTAYRVCHVITVANEIKTYRTIIKTQFQNQIAAMNWFKRHYVDQGILQRRTDKGWQTIA